MKKVFHFLQFILVLLVTFPVSLLPLRSALSLGGLLGTCTYLIWKSRRAIALDNIRKAINHNCLSDSLSPEDVALGLFRHLGKSFVELVRVYHGRGNEVIDSVTLEGTENLQKAAAHKKGVLIVTGHYGNWELLALAFSIKVSRASVVARKQNNVYLNRVIERVRRRLGNSVIYKKGALKAIFAALKKEGIVGILYDQSVVRSEGVLVDFLCREAWTMKMPVVISQKTGSPLLPVFIRRTPDGHRITIHPPYLPCMEEDLKTHLRKLNGYIEKHIQEEPTQWLWIHRRWKRRGSRNQ